jgi:hypothetical protein
MKLSKLSMPTKRKAIDMAALKDGPADEGSPEEEASESPEEEASEDDGSDGAEGAPDDAAGDDSHLAAVSDDELMAEIKKRGLAAKLMEHGDAPAKDDSMGPQDMYR